MVVNPDKFQLIILNRNNRMSDEHFLNNGETKITSEKWVTLLEVKIDNKW